MLTSPPTMCRRRARCLLGATPLTTTAATSPTCGPRITMEAAVSERRVSGICSLGQRFAFSKEKRRVG